jgi:hypothetical protein
MKMGFTNVLPKSKHLKFNSFIYVFSTHSGNPWVRRRTKINDRKEEVYDSATD